MTLFNQKLRGFVASKIEGSDGPATSFEDIGKSRLMQLSNVKKVNHFLTVLAKKAKDKFYNWKSFFDE